MVFAKLEGVAGGGDRSPTPRASPTAGELREAAGRSIEQIAICGVVW